jgi:ABC-type lipoprotein export system ATPase subunit
MTDEPYFIQKLQLQGFRAFLRPQEFDFRQKRCLALFAPNGKGKSSMIDALEFMFSDDGTLDRLGIRAVNNQAGPSALTHNRAEEKEIVPRVSIDFVHGKEASTAVRAAGSGKRPLPTLVKTVRALLTADPIIRGHSLRTFVETNSPEQRYTDVATWLQLGPLVDVQKNLRALRTQVKSMAEDTTALSYVDANLRKETANAVSIWNIGKVLEYANSAVLGPFDEKLVLKGLDATDAVYVVVTERVCDEERQLGLTGLQQIRATAAILHDRTIDSETGEKTITGAILAFKDADAALSKAVEAESRERGRAANAAFQALWKAAEPLFAEGTSGLEACPVCATPLADTSAGSVAGVRAHLAHGLEKLADYAVTKKRLDKATTDANLAQTELLTALPGLSALLNDTHEPIKVGLTAYGVAVEAWMKDGLPDSTPLTTALEALMDGLDSQIAEIKANQGDHTYAKAKAKLDRLLELQVERILAERTQAELKHLSQSLTALATTVSGGIRMKVQALLDTLQMPMNEIYQKIQGNDAVPIRLVLPAEDDSNQQRLNLVIDFAKNRIGVPPGGYLSDSQIHSVSLALRTAAILQFNTGAPIMALDDVVTSYDADHRRAIAAMIATILVKCQLIITTHDERFFNYLKDQLSEKDWHFSQITRLDHDFGPRFADHKVTDVMIEARWNTGESAANEIRQAEEEWLLAICRDFVASVPIHSLERAYSYERSELASALASFLAKSELEPKLVTGVNNKFLTSLQRGAIENFGSHFSDAPYGDGSIGDERSRWEEFKTFRGQFACPKCKRTKFKRPPGLTKPVCANRECEAQFEFVVRP